MRIISMEYRNFRNIEQAKLVFDSRMNLICGINGQGKTNALEAICYLSTGRSYRPGVKEKDFLTVGKEEGSIAAIFEGKKKRKMKAEVRFFKNRRRETYLNGLRVEKASDFFARLSVVSFFPEYMSIVRDGPAARRAFLDSAISQVDRGYLRGLQTYNRILEQRNRLLSTYFRDPYGCRVALGPWNEQMAAYCASIAAARKKYLDMLQIYADDVIQRMTGGTESLSLVYCKNFSEEDYFCLLNSHIPKEGAAGFSCYGVHRDDFGILLNGRSARLYASEGQRKSIAVALKMGEARICNLRREEEPIILLDDVLSELDPGRQEYLLFAFPGLKTGEEGPEFRLNRQFLITTCDRRFARVEEGLGRRFFVDHGQFTQM